MDTRGLAEVGLNDLQCCYRGLNPGEVAGQLFNLAVYLVDNGMVIDNGDTVQSNLGNETWRAQYTDALVQPDRVVLELDPGDPHSTRDLPPQ